MAKDLDSGVLLIWQGQGHTSYPEDPVRHLGGGHLPDQPDAADGRADLPCVTRGAPRPERSVDGQQQGRRRPRRSTGTRCASPTRRSRTSPTRASGRSTSSSTSSPSARASCSPCGTGRRRSSAGPAGCSRAPASPRGWTTPATRSTRSGCRRTPPSGCRPRTSPSPAGGRRTRSRPTRWRSSPGAPNLGTLTFHPWPVSQGRRRVARPDPHRPRPAAGHRLLRRGVGGPARAGAAGRVRHAGVAEDLRRPRRAHLRADPAALDLPARCAGR